MQFDAQQKAAIEACVDRTKRVVGVTGPAGTGKSSIIQAVHGQLEHAYGEDSIAVACPTGKAAKRVYEATGIRAQTIHRLLKYPRPGERDEKGRPLQAGYPQHDRNNPLPFAAVLIDEYAMTNWEVHRNLFDACRNGTVLRLFGDLHQLRPIESTEAMMRQPSPFATMLQRFPALTLTQVYRQSGKSGVLHNAQRILARRFPERLDDFVLQFTEQPVKTLQNYVLEQYDAGVDFSAIDNQIIVPGRKSWVGTIKLNAMLQSMFRPESTGWLRLPRRKWQESEGEIRVREGDKVIVTENNYDLDVFNGEIGLVVNTEDDTVVVDFGDRVVSFPREYPRTTRDGRTTFYDTRVALDLAYALTTHKMQGSECKRVVYVLNKSSRYNQSRSNLYTAITRARDSVHIITDQASLQFSINFAG